MEHNDESGHHDQRRADNAEVMKDSPSPAPTEEDQEEDEEGDEDVEEDEEEGQKRASVAMTAITTSRQRRARMYRHNREAPRNEQGEQLWQGE